MLRHSQFCFRFLFKFRLVFICSTLHSLCQVPNTFNCEHNPNSMSNTSGSTGNTNINNFQPGAIANNMNGINAVNPMNGMVNNMNFAAGNGNLSMQNSIQSNLNPNANLNNFNVNDYLRLQQQLQQEFALAYSCPCRQWLLAALLPSYHRRRRP